MVDYLKIFEKCRDTFCGDIFTKKELETSKNEYTKSANKECIDKKDFKKRIKCSMKILSKSNYKKLLKKQSNCSEQKCKKERDNFRNSFSKSLKKNRKNKK